MGTVKGNVQVLKAPAKVVVSKKSGWARGASNTSPCSLKKQEEGRHKEARRRKEKEKGRKQEEKKQIRSREKRQKDAEKARDRSSGQLKKKGKEQESRQARKRRIRKEEKHKEKAQAKMQVQPLQMSHFLKCAHVQVLQVEGCSSLFSLFKCCQPTP